MEEQVQDEHVERNLAGEIKPPLLPADTYDPFQERRSAKQSGDHWDRRFQLHS